MPNSSSSKYVKRRAHRRTKSRRHAKKYTVKKVMRGCSSNQYGGAAPLGTSPVGGTREIPTLPNSTLEQKELHAEGASSFVALNQLVGATQSKEYTPTVEPKTAPPRVEPKTAPQKGGYKSKHRRRRYKKSIGRKGRSRRFRGSRK